MTFSRPKSRIIALIPVLFAALTPLRADLGEAWRELAEYDNRPRARELFARIEGDPLADIGWFLTFTGEGPTIALRDAALTILEKDPEGPAAEFILKWVEPFEDCLPEWIDRAGALMEGRNPANPELKALFVNHLRLLARQRSESPAFIEQANEAGFITAWKLSERFGSYPIPAFEKAWPAEKPEYWAESGADYETRTGVVVPSGDAMGSGALYAFSAFDNPAKQDVLFRLFSYQNTALYLNGELLAVERNLETLSPNIFYYRTRLPAGRHEIVVKISQTRNSNGQFSLQAVAAQIPAFPAPKTPQFALAEARAETARPDVGLAAAIADRDAPMADFVRAFLAGRLRDEQTAHELLTALQERYPRSSLIGGELARLQLRFAPFLPREEQAGRAFQILNQLAREGGPQNAENRMLLAALLASANQIRPALELLNAVLEENPGYCDAIETRLALAGRESLLDVRQQTLGLLEAMGPDHRWAQVQLLEEARREGNLEQTQALLSNLGRLMPWDGYEAQLHEMNENYRAAIEDYTRRCEIFSDRDFYPYAIAQSYGKLGEREAQREWLDKTLAVNPAKTEALLDIVNLDCFEGQRERAMERLRDYLQVEPANPVFRQKLSHLEGANAFERYRASSAEVIEAAKNKPLSEGADSELLLDQLMVRLFPDGSQMRYTHLVTRVLTKDGVDRESELQLPDGLEFLELRTIKQDGSVHYPESFENKSSISLSALGVGDFIDEEHIEYLPPAYYDSDGLDANMTFIFQGIDRIYHHSELVLIYPADLAPEPTLLSRNMPVEPEIHEEGGLKYVRWLTKDMPPLKTEPAMPPSQYLQPTASFFYNTNWLEIRDYYRNAIYQRLGLSNRVKAQVETWRAEETDPRKLAEKVYKILVDRTEPDSQFYRNVNLVWETKTGNPTLLLAAVYKELGLDCDIVLSQPAQIKEMTFDTPMPNFSYVLLRLQFEDETVWVDANHRGLAFGYLPSAYGGARAMSLDPEAPLFTELPKGDDGSERVETVYIMNFEADGSVFGLGTERFFGLPASQIADRYKAMNRPEIKHAVEAGLNQTFPGAAVKEVILEDEEEEPARGEFTLSHVFQHPDLLQMEGGEPFMPFPLPPTPIQDRFGSLPSRDTPLHVPSPYFNDATVIMRLPETYRWTVEPETREVRSRFGEYSLTVTPKEDRELEIKRVYRLKAGFIQPDDYQEFLEFSRAMVDNEDLVFRAVEVNAEP